MTKNHLVVEGAGGVLVPLNSKDCIIDLIEEQDLVVVVSRHYLGSINHTLLTVESLINSGKKILGLVFSGDQNSSTESIILSKTKLPMIGRIKQETVFNKQVIAKYALEFKQSIGKIIRELDTFN